MWTSIAVGICLSFSVQSYLPNSVRRCPGATSVVAPHASCRRVDARFAFADDAPSDYDSDDIQDEKRVTVDENEEDAQIRDALKRELLLLSSVTNRGEYANLDEQNMLIDLVSQLEALNPTINPASQSEGEWDLCLSSTQFFRSSPFFQSIRIAAGDDNKQLVRGRSGCQTRSFFCSNVISPHCAS